MSDTKFDICSRALALIGVPAIASFSDGTTESTVAGQFYEATVRVLFSRRRWRFASTQAELSREAGVPEAKWSAIYPLPTGLLILHGLTLNDNQFEYDRYGNSIFCDLGADDRPVADYTYRADELVWPAFFVEAVVYDLAAKFAAAITRSADMAKLKAEEALMKLAEAKVLDAQQQPPRKLPTSRFISNR